MKILMECVNFYGCTCTSTLIRRVRMCACRLSTLNLHTHQADRVITFGANKHEMSNLVGRLARRRLICLLLMFSIIQTQLACTIGEKLIVCARDDYIGGVVMAAAAKVATAATTQLKMKYFRKIDFSNSQSVSYSLERRTHSEGMTTCKFFSNRFKSKRLTHTIKS